MTVDEIMKLVSAYDETCLECIDMNHKHLDCVRRSERRTALESVIEVLAKERDELKAAVLAGWGTHGDFSIIYCQFCGRRIEDIASGQPYEHAPDCIVKRYEEKARGGVK